MGGLFADLEDLGDEGEQSSLYADLPDLEEEPATYYDDPDQDDMTVGDVEVGAPETDTNDDQHSVMRRLLAYGDGLVGNYGGEIANAVTRGAEWLSPQGLSGIGEQDPQMAEDIVTQASQQHPGYNTAGQVTSAVAAGATAPARIAAQAGVGAAHSALSEYGDSHDLGQAGVAGVEGGAMAGGAAAFGKGMGKMFGRAPEGPVMQLGEEMPMAPRPFNSPQYDGISPRQLQNMDTYVGPAPQAHPAGPMPKPSAPPDMLRELAGAAMSPRKAMLKAGGQAIAGAAGNVPNEAVGRGSTAVGQTFGEGLEALARDHTGRVAADESVVNWALKRALSDNPGLTAKDTQAMNELVQTGDQYAIATKLYTLTQRSPLFAKQYERALNKANGDRE